MALHRVLDPDFDLAEGQPAEILGEEAHHAVRVKRLQVGDALELLDGRGTIALARVELVEKVSKGAWRLLARVERCESAAPVRPWVEVWSATPKGGRVEGLIEQLSQVGAAVWRPLQSVRTIVDPREGKLDRLERVARESAKQCGRAHVLRVGTRASFAQALREPDALGVRPITLIALIGGRSIADALAPVRAGERPLSVRLLVGPEGDWTDQERDEALVSGAVGVGLGPHAMRTETAAVMIAGLTVALLSGRDSDGDHPASATPTGGGL